MTLMLEVLGMAALALLILEVSAASAKFVLGAGVAR